MALRPRSSPSALIPTVKKAIAAGIPVDSFNSGFDYWQQAGALTHFSSDERLAGQEAGKKMKADGAAKILCTIQQAGSVALEDRCAGVKDSFPNTENLQVNGADDAAVTSAIQAKLSQDKDINWVITLGAPQALDTLKAFEGSGSSAKVGTFDTNPDAAQAVKDGKIQFYIDQQPTCGATWPSHGSISLRTAYPRWWQAGSITRPSSAATTSAILPFVQNNTR
jgi:simple sugar transport system substrate-binding protein